MTTHAASSPRTIALIGTYPPRECGIATFTDDLAGALRAAGVQQTPIVALTDNPGRYEYPEAVRYQIRQGRKNDYIKAAEYLNYSDVSMVSIQHEYGIFGGTDGAFVLDLIAHLTKPYTVTLHTVLDEPSTSQREIVRTMVQQGGQLVVMSHKAVELLATRYGIEGPGVRVIPHGIPDVPSVDPDEAKQRVGLAGKRVILTFGLLSPGKGIESGIRALASVVPSVPDVVYLVVGATHPEIKRREGERYRHSLESLADEISVRDHLVFRNAFVTNDELIEYLQAADIMLTPYVNEKQITSGVLAYAMGTGAAPVSTPYWHAQELLADGRGCQFPFGDAEALASILSELLTQPKKLARVQHAAHAYSRSMTWDHVGAAYVELFAQHAHDHGPAKWRTAQELTLPELRLDHLDRLTDDTGVIQHARYSVPRRSSGYCVDDNARALVVALHAHAQLPSATTRRLISTCLAYIEHAQSEDGAFHNFMTYARTIDPTPPSQDCVGRALWALGEASCLAPDQGQRQLATGLFHASMSQPLEFGPRGAALSILGLDAYMQSHDQLDVVSSILKTLADRLVDRFETESTDDWQWFEPTVTYDNGLIPLSLFKAYAHIHDPAYLRVAGAGLDFLEQTCFAGDHLALVGNTGWHSRGGERAVADEQPLDATALVLAFRSAYLATGDHRMLQRMRQCFEWFLGKNRLGVPVYDYTTGGCRDGLGITRPNENQGAESTVSFLIASLAMSEVISEMPSTRDARQVAGWGRGLVDPKTMPPVETAATT